MSTSRRRLTQGLAAGAACLALPAGLSAPAAAAPSARSSRTPDSAVSGISLKALIVCAVGFVAAIAAELAATAGMSLVDWEAEWAESGTALAVGMIVAAVIAIVALLIVKRNAGKKAAVN